jgi:hypothetical protein
MMRRMDQGAKLSTGKIVESLLPRNTVSRSLLAAVGGAATVAASFFGTLFLLNSMDSKTRDAQRKEDVRILKSALGQYHAARGVFPAPFPDNSADDLKAALG